MIRSSKKVLFLVGLVVTLGNLQPLHGSLNLSLSGFQSGGFVSYPGGGSPLQGSVGIDTINAPGGTEFCFCNFTFTTGQLTGSSATSWMFGPGGSLNFSGTVFNQSPNTPLIPTGTLLTGSLLDTTLTIHPSVFGNLNLPASYTLTANFLATFQPSLLNLLGLPGGIYKGSLSVLTGSTSPNLAPPNAAGCTSCIDEVSISLAPVPEPGTLLLLATVLAAALSATRKRKAKLS
jgi:hypothetical protein